MNTKKRVHAWAIKILEADYKYVNSKQDKLYVTKKGERSRNEELYENFEQEKSLEMNKEGIEMNFDTKKRKLLNFTHIAFLFEN